MENFIFCAVHLTLFTVHEKDKTNETQLKPSQTYTIEFCKFCKNN